MKKAKFMLMAIAVIGIAGGAFAFKAMNFTGTVSTWSKCNTAAFKCNLTSGQKTYAQAKITGTVESVETIFTSDPNTPCTIDADCQVPQYTIFTAL